MPGSQYEFRFFADALAEMVASLPQYPDPDQPVYG